MAYSAIVGSFNIDPAVTVGNTQAITGLGFQPKIVMFWWGGSTGTGDTVAGGNICFGFGAAISSSSRFEICVSSTDASANSDTYSNSRADDCIRVYSNGGGTLDGEMDFTSMDAGGFTLTVNDQFTNAYRISYLALGGTDLTNVYIGNKQGPASTGNYSVTGVGFQPDAIITAGNAFTAGIGASGAYGVFEMGMATGASNEGVIHTYQEDGGASSNTSGYGYNGSTVSLGVSFHHEFVSFDADGFTLNNLEGTTQYWYHFIALKGGQYSVGDLTTRTDGNDITETVGFQPVAVLFASANRALSTYDTRSTHARLSVGAGTSTSNRAAAAYSDESGLADTETAYANYDTAVYANILDDAIVGLMDIKSIDASGFTCVMDDTDPAGCWVTYLAIGAAAASGNVNLLNGKLAQKLRGKL